MIKTLLKIALLGIFLAMFYSCKPKVENFKNPTLNKLCEVKSIGREEMEYNPLTRTILKYNSSNETKPLLIKDNGEIIKELPYFNSTSFIMDAFFYDTSSFYMYNFNTELIKYDKDWNEVNQFSFRAALDDYDSVFSKNHQGLEPLGKINATYKNGYVIMRAFTKNKFVRVTSDLVESWSNSKLIKFEIANDSIVSVGILNYSMADILKPCYLTGFLNTAHLDSSTFSLISRSYPKIHFVDYKTGKQVKKIIDLVPKTNCDECKSEEIEDILEYRLYKKEHCPYVYKIVINETNEMFAIVTFPRPDIIDGLKSTIEQSEWQIFHIVDRTTPKLIFKAESGQFSKVSTTISKDKVFLKAYPNEGKADIYSFNLPK